MRPIIGISVASDHVCMVLVRDGRIVWQAEEACALPVDGPETISAMLCQAPVRDRPRPRISAALGLQGSQVRRIRGLPTIDDQAVLEAIIREAMPTFFLSEEALVPTSVVLSEPGVVWAGALDAGLLELVRQGCQARGWRLHLAAPTAAALLHSCDDDHLDWVDGDLLLTVARASGQLTDVKRSLASKERSVPLPQGPDDSFDVGDPGARSAPAFGVTQLARGDGLVLAVKERPWTGGEFRRAMRLPLLLLATASATLSLSPLAWRAVEWNAGRRIDSMELNRWADVGTMTEQIAQVNDVLEQARAFHADRSSVLAFLDRLAERLPDSVFVADLRLDRNQVLLSVVGPERFDHETTFDGFPGVSYVEDVETPTATPPDAALRRTGIRIQLVPNDSLGLSASPGGQ